jgi:hypothetical protein
METSKKIKYFHVLNDRKRKEKFEQEQHEQQVYDSVYNDRRRDNSTCNYDRAYPLIEDE